MDGRESFTPLLGGKKFKLNNSANITKKSIHQFFGIVHVSFSVFLGESRIQEKMS
jgi:hypothetical protein